MESAAAAFKFGSFEALNYGSSLGGRLVNGGETCPFPSITPHRSRNPGKHNILQLAIKGRTAVTEPWLERISLISDIYLNLILKEVYTQIGNFVFLLSI